MGIARLVGMRSTCSRLHVGACAALDGRILVTAYNGAPSGMPHCDHNCVCANDYPETDPLCPAHNPCSTAVHAEANLVAFAARHGIRLQDADIFTTDTPCLPCGQLLINTGIQRVVYSREYRDKRGLYLLEDAGILAQKLEVV